MNKAMMVRLGFKKEVELVNMGKCPGCKEKVNPEDFRNEISVREYKISGLCQECQDNIFGAD